MSMIPDETPAHLAPGHNQPPSPVELVRELQRQSQTQELADRLAYFVMKADAKQVTDRLTAGDAGDIIRLAGEFMDPIEARRLALSRPYREAADAAKAECDRFLEPLREAVISLQSRLDAWGKEEDKRIADQQAEQDRFFSGGYRPSHGQLGPSPVGGSGVPPKAPVEINLTVDQGAPLLPAKRRPVRGDLGALVSAVDKKSYTVVDVHKVPDIILNSKTVHDAIIQVARSMAKHMPEIEGIQVTTETGTQVR